MIGSIMDPDYMLVQNDEFYLFYEMLMQSLKTDNVKEGINKSLFMLKSYLKSGNIALYRKNKDGMYVYKMSDSQMNDFTKEVGYIINTTKTLFEQKGMFYLDLNLSEKLNNIMILHIDFDKFIDESCLVILNINKNKELEPQFWERVKDTIQIILKRATIYNRNIKAITTDLLTGLDNRNSYEMRIKSFDEAENNLVLGIFDLFRLKHINDNYNHAKGDEYIIRVAQILNKYWPKYNINNFDDGTEETVNTDNCVYRVGGDEFVLLTTNDNIQLATIKAELAKDEAALIDLGLGENIPIGISYGMVIHNPGSTLKQTLMRADKIMQEDKTNMYKQYKLERRHQ